jgi:aspartate-semialdehyde dehydrogenase
VAGRLKVGFVGWRGMVGQVLLARMLEEDDFTFIIPTFFSTSQVGALAPHLPEHNDSVLQDANDVTKLTENDVIVSMQGGEYTKSIYTSLRATGWQGYWIDAASTLRMHDDACIVLDPVNRKQIDLALHSGIKTYVGGNCTVSLLLMALAPLLQTDMVEWVSTMTYQSASGAGSQAMQELLQQTQMSFDSILMDNSALESEAHIRLKTSAGNYPQKTLSAPLAFSLLPFIDTLLDDGSTREEWKGSVELNKILETTTTIPVDGVCVRVPVLRCHSQAFLLKLKKPAILDEVTALLESAHEWIDVVPNNKEATLQRLTPTAISGSLKIAVGRLKTTKLGPEYLAGFTVGDQLLWGAAEPLRRMLRILLP